MVAIGQEVSPKRLPVGRILAFSLANLPIAALAVAVLVYLRRTSPDTSRFRWPWSAASGWRSG